jgi:hypothetical protein
MKEEFGGAGLLRNFGEELSHRVPIGPEEESKMGMGEPILFRVKYVRQLKEGQTD